MTAALDSGERFFARFLVTNQGPGDRTAAAVGHLVRTDGTLVPFQWGRRRDEWTLGPGGQSLQIGKATLDLAGPTLAVTIDSKKHGIDLRLAIDQPAGAIMNSALRTPYAADVVMPAAARGTLATDAASPRHPVTGWGAVTHTWTDRPESEVLRRRDELFARGGDVALYVSSVVLVDGTRRSTGAVRRPAHVESVSALLTFGDATLGGSDYPVARTWEGRAADVVFHATLDRELLRMNPLDILPEPFRFLLSLGGRPERLWADARVTVDFSPDGEGPAEPTDLRGIAVTTFARPEK